jgi:hypothetical protein
VADNYTTAAGSGGNTYASDDISSVHFSRIKLIHGADGTNDGDVSTVNGLPVDIRALNGVDLMLGTDFSSVLGTASLVLGTQADNLANTSDGVQTSSMMYVYDGSTWDRLRGDATHGALVNLGANNDVTVTSGAIAATNAGTFVVQENGAALTALQLLDNAIQADGAGTPGTTMVAGTKRQNSLSDLGPSVVDGDTTLVRVNARGAVWTELDSTNDAKITLDGEAVVLGAGTAEFGKLAAGTALVGDVGLSGARTSGGTTLHQNIDVDESEDVVKATAGQVYWIHAMNLTAAVLYLKIYNATVATVTVGTTAPDLTFPIPTQGDTNGAGFALSIPNGIAFSTAITIACTTGIATADTGAPAANACVVNMGFA